jgi:hypothetical protein
MNCGTLGSHGRLGRAAGVIQGRNCSLQSTQGDLKTLHIQQLPSMGASLSLLSSRAKPRDLQFTPPSPLMCMAKSIVIPTEAHPDFLPRSTGQGRVCAFP